MVRNVAPWKLRLETRGDELEQAPRRVVKPCVHFGLLINVGLAALSVGAVVGPSNNHSYPKISMEIRMVAEERPHQPPSTPTLAPRMAVAVSSGIGAANSVIPVAPSFPIQQVKWRQGLLAAPEAAEYIALCRRGGDFPINNLQQIMDDRAKLVTAAGGLFNAARQIRLIRFRELRYDR